MKIESSKKYIERLKSNRIYFERRERELFDEMNDMEMMRNRNKIF